MTVLPNEPIPQSDIREIAEIACGLCALIDDFVMTEAETEAFTAATESRYEAGERRLLPGPHWRQFFDGEATQGDARKFLIARLEWELKRLKGQS